MVQETARINFETGNLDVVEGRIKALGGAINLLGGAVETTVGLMGLLGVDDKVQKQFQEAATSAIAFADGTKRIFEGYKELREAADLFRKAQNAANVATVAGNAAQASSVGLLGKARAAWNALTAAMIRNPITAVVVGLTALAGALYLYSQRTDDAAEANDNLAQSNKDLAESFKQTQEDANLVNSVYIKNLQARGASQRFILQEEVRLEQENIARIKKAQKENEAEVLYSQVRLNNLRNQNNQAAYDAELENLKALLDIRKDLGEEELKASAELAKKRLDIVAYDREKREEDIEKRKAENERIKQEELRAANDLLRFKIKLTEELALFNKKGREKEVLELELWYNDQKRLAQGNQDVLLLLQQLYEKKSLEITKRYFDLAQQQRDEANQKIIQTEQDKNNRINQLLGVDVQIRRNDEIKLLQERLQTLREMGDQETLLYKQIQDAITKLQKEGLEERSSKLKEFFESDAAKTIGASLQTLNQVTSGILSIAQESSERRLNNIEAEYSARINAIQGTDEQAAAQREALEQQMNAKMEAERRKAFEDQKKLRIADTITGGISSAFQAFSSAIGQLGPVAGPVIGGILSAMILAQMAATVSNIKKTQYVSAGGGGGATSAGAGVGGMNVSNIGGGFSGGGQFGGNLSSGGSTPISSGGSNFMTAPNTNPNTPIRAYVVANDVSTGLDAQQALNNRRTF